MLIIQSALTGFYALGISALFILIDCFFCLAFVYKSSIHLLKKIQEYILNLKILKIDNKRKNFPLSPSNPFTYSKVLDVYQFSVFPKYIYIYVIKNTQLKILT